MKRLTLILSLFAATIPFMYACEDGGAEEVGEDIDEGIDEAAESVEDTLPTAGATE